MTMENVPIESTFAGNGTTGPFQFTFRFFSNADIVVTHLPAGGASAVLAEGVDYFLTGAGSYAGGAVVLASALVAGDELHVERLMDFKQPIDFKNQGEFYPERHEEAFDRLLMLMQQIQASGVSALPSGWSYGAAPPTTGDHSVTEVVLNSSPVAGENLGWICTASGTPGTWKAWGVISL